VGGNDRITDPDDDVQLELAKRRGENPQSGGVIDNRNDRASILLQADKYACIGCRCRKADHRRRRNGQSRKCTVHSI
jgi:hypothetical protein